MEVDAANARNQGDSSTSPQAKQHNWGLPFSKDNNPSTNASNVIITEIGEA